MKNGMKKKKEKKFRKLDQLFSFPLDIKDLSAGMGRNWPDARGIFHNHLENLFIHVNNEDHLKIESIGDENIREVAQRLLVYVNELETSLKFLKS